MSPIGNRFDPVILNPAAPNVTLVGTIDAYGPLFTAVTTSSAGVTGTLVLKGAVGGSGAAFNITNTGTVATSGISEFATAIILTSPGIVTNTGHISGGSGILMFGGQPTGYVRNTGYIGGMFGAGVYLYAGGRVSNAGFISGQTVGVYLGGPGGVSNAGIIESVGNGVIATYGAANIYNTGTISGSFTYGVAFQGTLVNGPHGLIFSNGTAVSVTHGAMYNRGKIEGGSLGIQIVNDAQLRNAGFIFGNIAIQNKAGTAGGGEIYNAASGHITGFHDGIYLMSEPGAYDSVGNAGYINAVVNTAVLIESGRVFNTGTIHGADGIDLLGAATVTNSGLIEGSIVGIIAQGGATIIDSGTIVNQSGDAIDLSAGAPNRLVLDASAVIIGPVILNGALELARGQQGARGIRDIKGIESLTIDSGAIWDAAGKTLRNARIFNDGTLRATPGKTALIGGGPVYNYGLIKGGAGVSDAGGYAYNAGKIDALNGTGIALTTPGYIINAARGIIEGAVGVSLAANSALYNYGSITGGVTAGAGAAIYNYARGLITGGITLAGGSVYDAGTISGAATAIDFTGSQANRLILAPGGSIQGALELGGGALQLDAGAKAGTISLADFTTAQNVTIATGAAWTISGTAAASMAVTNNGTVIASSTLTIDGSLLGAGTIGLAGGLVLDGDVASGQKIRFTGTDGTLALGAPAAFAGAIQKFAPSDTIDLTGIALSGVTGDNFTDGVFTIAYGTGAITLTFVNPASLANETFALFADGGGTGITLTGAAAANSLTPVSYGTPQATGTKSEIVLTAKPSWLTHEIVPPTPPHTPPITIS